LSLFTSVLLVVVKVEIALPVGIAAESQALSL